MTPQALGKRELALLHFYCGCQFSMTPHEFYARWGVTHTQIAQICGISEASVDRWFSHGKHRRVAEVRHRRKLAEMHFLWEHYERVPLELVAHICSPPRNGQVPSP
ncbi:MAG: hypothetical protein RBJ76_00645 [Stenomitos frigidus ULC029]